jgi:hypothetical protein
MGIFTLIPKWKQTLFENGLVTGPSLFGNGYPFLYGDPHIETGSRVIRLAIWKWGLNYPPHFHMGNHCTEMGRETKIFPYGDSPFPNRVCSHLGINIYTT